MTTRWHRKTGPGNEDKETGTVPSAAGLIVSVKGMGLWFLVQSRHHLFPGESDIRGCCGSAWGPPGRPRKFAFGFSMKLSTPGRIVLKFKRLEAAIRGYA